MEEDLLAIQAHLTDRDHVLLGWLAEHGVLTSFQIAHALYPSLDFAQRRLRALCQTKKVLGRFRPFRAEGGTFPYHYVLSQKGTDVVAAQRGDPVPRRDQARQRRWHLTSRANLPHLLGVNGFFTDLAGYARTHPEAALERWWPAARFTTMGGFAEPGDPPTLLIRIPKVRPDGHGIFTERERRVPFYLEHDTGTEPLPVLVDKLDAYEDLAVATGRVYPVLFWLHSSLRERHLHQRLTDARIRHPVATAARDRAARMNPAEAIWWLHGRPGPLQRLTQLPASAPAAAD
ncbi:replication-relaxation family protein [Paractinoplanes lichenicola]|uniref:Replication-relaxation family protein n=1 Tax=Paractinoplanes lichenicola TaxID=2802976 RepID=A0ABS1W3Q2_9ACTN|nr:replication-relaxation family protein [Actinoplanes lichenicola]MBL7261362.1 replication-relaxation family protein [Actinoplanes lichenicola]